MSLKVRYIDVPQGAQEAAQVTGQGQPFSDPSTAAAGAQDVAYATLEPKGWPLDGSRSILPDEPGGFWWSQLPSGNNGAFADPPSLTFLFPETYTATGLSFTFWPSTNEWCSRLRITWYQGDTAIFQTVASPDAPQWTLQKTVEAFDRIHVEILQTNMPGHFAKVQKIEIGQVHWFDQTEITSVHLLNEIDPTLSDLTVDTMQINIQDRKDRGLVPQKNQRMELYRNGDLFAVQYIADSSRQAQRYYAFSCQSAIGLLEDDYLGGIYDSVPAETVLQDILDGIDFELDAVFQGKTVTGYLPICTRREALHQVAFSLGAVVSTQNDGKIRLLPLPSSVTAFFDRSHIFHGATVETMPNISKVEVVAHRYAQIQEAETLLDAQTITGENVLVTFDQPHHGYEITGGQITGSSANWVTVTANGSVTLTGKKYLHSTARYIQQNPVATIAERNNVYAVEESTLVHTGNVQNVIRRLYAIAQLRQNLTQEVVVTGQRAGQKATSQNPWGTMLQGYITSMESDLSANGHTASVTILCTGVNVNTHFYSGELYSGDTGGIY